MTKQRYTIDCPCGRKHFLTKGDKAGEVVHEIDETNITEEEPIHATPKGEQEQKPNEKPSNEGEDPESGGDTLFDTLFG